jgi:adenosylcobinamide-GDP ribazoletransferase
VNALRLAFGTLTVLPVRPPTVDRRTAGHAMLLAPVVGVALALVVLVEIVLLEALVPQLLTAVLLVGTLALLTRGMHLDGLADTADGLGSGRPADGALEVMRKGDVGPFGVVTLVLVLLAQVVSVGYLLTTWDGPVNIAAALVVSRLALPLACVAGVPAARPEGLGATVAGSVPRPAAALVGLAAVVAAAVVAVVSSMAVWATFLGLLGGLAVAARAVRRFGGVTGDVLGAVVEATFTVAVVALVAVAGP